MNDHAAPFQPLTETQRRELERDLPSSMVKQRQAGRDGSVSYLEGWQVLETANDIFGPDGWSYELVGDVRQVYEGQKKGRDGGENRVIVFEARVRVRVGASVREDVGSDTCDVPDRADALAQGIDKARKGAVTDAVKRALRTYGHVLGLALYDKSRRRIGASLECQRLLDKIDTHPFETLDAWCQENADAIRELPEGEQRALHDAVVERRRQAAKVQARQQVQSTSTAPAAQVPTPAPASVPPELPALATYRARVAAAPTIDVLVATALELAPSVASCREAAWSSACARAAELGADAETLTSGVTGARKISPDPAVWRTVAAFLGGLALATDRPAVDAVTKAQSAAVAALPDVLKAKMADALKRRRVEVATPTTPAGLLEKQLREAADIPALEAIGDSVAMAYTLGEITADEVKALTKLQDEFATAMEREVAA